jgi:propionate catabolism operon transcriptional regulator
VAYKIGIIASNLEMKKKLEALYPNETQGGQYLLRVLDNSIISEQGQELVASGAQLIIGRSGSYVKTVGNVTVPVLQLKVSTGDILNALIKASQETDLITLFLWDQIGFNENVLELIDAQVTIHKFSDGNEIEALFNAAIGRDFTGVVVGGGIVCSLAKERNIKSVFTNPSNESIQELLDYAHQILDNVHEVRYKNELLSTVVQGSHDAVIAIDEHHEIILFNQRAQHILKISPQYVLGKKLVDVFPELTFLILNLENRIVQMMLQTYSELPLVPR